MNKEKALKNQGLEFREDMVLYGGIFHADKSDESGLFTFLCKVGKYLI